jgi:hypothetical protein
MKSEKWQKLPLQKPLIQFDKNVFFNSSRLAGLSKDLATEENWGTDFYFLKIYCKLIFLQLQKMGEVYYFGEDDKNKKGLLFNTGLLDRKGFAPLYILLKPEKHRTIQWQVEMAGFTEEQILEIVEGNPTYAGIQAWTEKKLPQSPDFFVRENKASFYYEPSITVLEIFKDSPGKLLKGNPNAEKLCPKGLEKEFVERLNQAAQQAFSQIKNNSTPILYCSNKDEAAAEGLPLPVKNYEVGIGLPMDFSHPGHSGSNVKVVLVITCVANSAGNKNYQICELYDPKEAYAHARPVGRPHQFLIDLVVEKVAGPLKGARDYIPPKPREEDKEEERPRVLSTQTSTSTTSTLQAAGTHPVLKC